MALIAAARAAVPAGGKDEDSAWKQVTILYHSDVVGKVEPCG